MLRRRSQSALAGLRHDISQLAKNIQLELLGGGIADPHRAGVAVTSKVRKLDLVQPFVAHHAVHGLKLFRRARDHPGRVGRLGSPALG